MAKYEVVFEVDFEYDALSLAMRVGESWGVEGSEVKSVIIREMK